jgi:hypothetical protein
VKLVGRPGRWLALVLGLFAILLGTLVLLPPSQQRLPPLTVYSAAPSGAKALKLWLEALDYRVATLESEPYRLDATTDLLVVLAPTRRFGRPDLDAVEQWVRTGGTLVVATDGLLAEPLLARFGLRLRALPRELPFAETQGSLVGRPVQQVRVRTSEALVFPSGQGETFLTAGEQVIGIAVPFGAGRVFALSAPLIFSNQALGSEGNARLVLALLDSSKPSSIAFDEFHHGLSTAEARSLLSVLVDHAWGQAALLASGIVFSYLLLRGRRFGRARQVSVSRGRSLAEYVSSLASLYRAAGKREFIADHFQRRLRQELARSLGLPGSASDDQILARGRMLGREVEPPLQLLGRLRDRPAAEPELVQLVRQGEQAVTAVADAPRPANDGSGQRVGQVGEGERKT